MNAIGLLAVGSVALRFLAVGALGLGIVSFGALSVGCFSTVALAVGNYFAYGDHVYSMISIGKSVAEGSIYSHIGALDSADKKTVIECLNANVPLWLAWAKDFIAFFIF